MSNQLNKAWRFVSLFLLVLLVTTAPAAASEAPVFDEGETVSMRGKVLSVENLEPADDVTDFVEVEQLAEVEITTGAHKGEVHSLVNRLTGHPFFDVNLEADNKILLWGAEADNGELRTVYLRDRVRDIYLYFLAGLFILMILLVGGKKGLTTIITLGITVTAVFRVLLPMLLNGYSPIPATVLVAAGVTFITLLAIGGFHRKTFAALIGTVGGVLVAGALALVIGNLAYLTGFSSEEAQMLAFMESGSVDVRGLLFAGIIVGALGAVMDVAMSISAASHEVYLTDPTISVRRQIKSAMNVGRDVMGTMANTLILAYVGTSMGMLLLFMGNGVTYTTISNMDLVATEVVRAFAGSIGLIAAVPLTAVFSGLLRKTRKKTKEQTDVIPD